MRDDDTFAFRVFIAQTFIEISCEVAAALECSLNVLVEIVCESQAISRPNQIKYLVRKEATVNRKKFPELLVGFECNIFRIPKSMDQDDPARPLEQKALG